MHTVILVKLSVMFGLEQTHKDRDEFAEWDEISKRAQGGLLEKCRGGLNFKRKRASSPT
jgi:hypothetical protein